MPSLQMTPAGYIPPQAAIIGSGLAGISAQQTALQRQLNQEAEQRRKEAEQEAQAIGKTMYTLGETAKAPGLMSRGAGLMLGGAAPGPDSPLSETAFKAALDKAAAQEQMERAQKLLQIPGLTPASVNAIISGTPGFASFKTESGTPAIQIDRDVEPQKKVSRTELDGAIKRAYDALKFNRLSSDAFGSFNSVVSGFKTRLEAAKTTDEVKQIMLEFRAVDPKFTSPTKRITKRGGGFIFDEVTTVDPKTGTTVVTIEKMRAMPLNTMQQYTIQRGNAALAIARDRLGLSAKSLGLQTDASKRAADRLTLEVLGLVVPGVKGGPDYYQNVRKRAEDRLKGRIPGFASFNPVAKAKAQEEIAVGLEAEEDKIIAEDLARAQSNPRFQEIRNRVINEAQKAGGGGAAKAGGGGGNARNAVGGGNARPRGWGAVPPPVIPGTGR